MKAKSSFARLSHVLMRFVCLVTNLVFLFGFGSTIARAQENASAADGSQRLLLHAIWQDSLVDGGGNARADMDAAVDSAGRIHIVYLKVEENRDIVSYAVGTPNAWTIETVAMAMTSSLTGGYYPIRNPRIALDRNNAAHVIFWTESNRFEMVQYARKEAGAWMVEGVPQTDLSAGNAESLEFGFTRTGAPLIFYGVSSPASAFPFGLFKSFVREAAWTEFTVERAYPGGMALLHTVAGAPQAVYSTHIEESTIGHGGMMQRATLDSNTWHYAPLTTTVLSDQFEALLDSGGQYHIISQFDGQIYQMPNLQLVHQRLDEYGWRTFTIDATRSSIVMGNITQQANGSPAFIYANADCAAMTFAWWDGTEWRREHTFAFDHARQHDAVLIIAPSGPMIVYGNADGGIAIAQRVAVDMAHSVFLPHVHVTQ